MFLTFDRSIDLSAAAAVYEECARWRELVMIGAPSFDLGRYTLLATDMPGAHHCVIKIQYSDTAARQLLLHTLPFLSEAACYGGKKYLAQLGHF